jgi:hypothetical protein
MTAIHEDVAEEILDSIEQENLSTHQSEIERIAAKVEEGHSSEDEPEIDLSEEESFNSPMFRKDDEWYVNARVNGEDMEVPWDQVVSQYQKNSSADRRLQEVSERQRELAEYERQLNAYRASMDAQRTQPSSDVGTQQSPSSDATDALYEQYHEALFQGEESKASSLLKQIRSAEQPQSNNVDVQSIIERTKTEMREEEKAMQAQGYEMRRQEAVQMFQSEYPEITADPSLLAVADRRSAELYQSDPTRDPWDIMQECADYARNWLFDYVDDLGGSSNRKERKQGMDDVSPVNVRAYIGEDQEEMTYSDIISEMKKERGQTV